MSSRALVGRRVAAAAAPFVRDRRFAPGFASAVEVAEQGGAMSPEPELAPDPAALAYARGFAEGEAAAAAAHAVALAELESRYAGLGRGFEELALAEADLVRARLAEVVVQLCEATLAPLALDPEALAARVEKAAALLQRSADRRQVRLNPEDAELVRPLVGAGLTLMADPAIARGHLRIDTEDGGIEDGPETWRLALREALGLC